METSSYLQSALDFLRKTGTEMTVTFKKHDLHFEDDKEKRDIYIITLKRGHRCMSFDFGQSIVDSAIKIVNKNNNRTMRTVEMSTKFKDKDGKFKEQVFKQLCGWQFSSCDKIVLPKAPDEYSVLACMTKYDPGTFENFCDDFGYDTDSRRAENTYHAVKKEFIELCTIFSDKELEEMQEIQ